MKSFDKLTVDFINDYFKNRNKLLYASDNR